MTKAESTESYREVSRLINDHYAQKTMMAAMTPLWLETLGIYQVPDTRSRVQKLYHRLHYRTVGRFRAWLHRDCD